MCKIYYTTTNAGGPEIRQGPGFYGKFKLCLTPNKCVLTRRIALLVLSNFSETPCMKVGLEVTVSLVSVLSTVEGEASRPPSPPPPPQKSFSCKN